MSQSPVAGQVLEQKGRRLVTVDGSATALDAVRRMIESGVGSLLVTTEERIVGIVTEHDYLRRVTLDAGRTRETPVEEIMSTPLIYVTTATSLQECKAIMTERRIRHLPVLEGEDGPLVGLISIGDIVKFESQEQTYQLRYLTDYINAR